MRRATHLARDLIHEHAPDAEPDAHEAALDEIAKAGVVDAALAVRLAACIDRVDNKEAGAEEPTLDELLEDGAILDRFLRSIEHRALAPELPFVALASVGGIAESATSKSAVMVSGRQVLLAERGREGMVFVDDKPAGKPFPLLGAPRSKPQVRHEASGVTRIVWESENVAIELAADFASASIISPE